MRSFAFGRSLRFRSFASLSVVRFAFVRSFAFVRWFVGSFVRLLSFRRCCRRNVSLVGFVGWLRWFVGWLRSFVGWLRRRKVCWFVRCFVHFVRFVRRLWPSECFRLSVRRPPSVVVKFVCLFVGWFVCLLVHWFIDSSLSSSECFVWLVGSLAFLSTYLLVELSASCRCVLVCLAHVVWSLSLFAACSFGLFPCACPCLLLCLIVGQSTVSQSIACFVGSFVRSVVVVVWTRSSPSLCLFCLSVCCGLATAPRTKQAKAARHKKRTKPHLGKSLRL